jgi:hypothetical protein
LDESDMVGSSPPFLKGDLGGFSKGQALSL